MTRISKNQVKYIRSLSQKKQRDADGVFVAEGDKCIGEMLSFFEPLLLVSSSDSCFSSGVVGRDGSHYACLEASVTEIDQMSQLRSPQGSIGVFRRRATGVLPSATETLVLALDSVQDPGNLGTIIRTADWFGVRDMVCSLDSADCWNPKVVQATMGALARVRVHYTDLAAYVSRASGAGMQTDAAPVYGTLLDGRNLYDAGAIPQKKRGIIIMGNEGNGISPQIRKLITHPLFIPSYPADEPTSESLNVAIATAVVLAEFRRGIAEE